MPFFAHTNPEMHPLMTLSPPFTMVCRYYTIPYCCVGIDLTNNFIHEGTLFQLFVLRRFLAHKFNVVIILGGGTTTVGDPSYKIRRSNAAVGSSDTGCHADNAILNQECIVPSSSPENTSAILDIVTKVLTQSIEIPGGDIVHPSLSFSSELSESDVRRVTSSCYNVVCLNNRDLYDRVTLSEFLATVAGNMSVGRMLSRDCIKARMSFSESNATKLKANMNLAEFMYMSLQATDFIHVASKFNSILQLGGSDQMGNIMSGVDLSSSLGEAGKTVFGITTPLLRTPSGEKISKSVGEGLLKITTDTKPLAFWSHFRSVDDAVVEDYLRWLTRVPLSLIKDTMSRHINDGKVRLEIYRAILLQVLLADELTTAMFGRDYTDALHKYWLARDVGALTRSREDLSAEDYDSFVKFTKCVQSVALDPEELEGGVEFGSLLDQLRTPQMVSGKFYSNRRAIREGTCRINGSVVSSVNYKVGPGDLLRSSCKDGRVFKYITIQFGKHQLFFAILNQV